MRRRLFTFCSAVSLLLCAAVCVLWAARIPYRRVGNGWFIRGSRYTLSLSPDQMTILGPPLTDPAAGKSDGEIAGMMRTTGGMLRYHGTTAGMGFGDWDFFGDPPPAPLNGYPSVPDRRPAVRNASVGMLMAALEDERLFLVAHALLTETKAGEEASDHPQWTMKSELHETAWGSGHWTGIYDGVSIDLLEDRPRNNNLGSWGEEIWAVVTTPGMTPNQRADVCRRWHERLDVPLWTARYWCVALLALAIPASGLAARVVNRLRRRKRRVSGCCPACGYDLRASPNRCPECGTVTTRPTAA